MKIKTERIQDLKKKNREEQIMNRKEKGYRDQLITKIGQYHYEDRNVYESNHQDLTITSYTKEA